MRSRMPVRRWMLPKMNCPMDFPVSATIVDGHTVEEAVSKLDWHRW